jgi:hypothetical protein
MHIFICMHMLGICGIASDHTPTVAKVANKSEYQHNCAVGLEMKTCMHCFFVLLAFSIAMCLDVVLGALMLYAFFFQFSTHNTAKHTNTQLHLQSLLLCVLSVKTVYKLQSLLRPNAALYSSPLCSQYTYTSATVTVL